MQLPSIVDSMSNYCSQPFTCILLSVTMEVWGGRARHNSWYSLDPINTNTTIPVITKEVVRSNVTACLLTKGVVMSNVTACLLMTQPKYTITKEGEVKYTIYNTNDVTACLLHVMTQPNYTIQVITKEASPTT